MTGKFFLPFLLLVLFGIPASAQDAKFTALFVFNFAKYLEWSPEISKGDFVITILGDDPVEEELRVVSEKATVGTQKIVVKHAKSLEQVETSQILYVSPGKSSQLAAVLAKYGETETLVVTNKDGLGKEGAAINITMIDGKQRYEINTGTLKKCGLKAKPVLFKLGKVIES